MTNFSHLFSLQCNFRCAGRFCPTNLLIEIWAILHKILQARVVGIEPTQEVLETSVLPLYDTRK